MISLTTKDWNNYSSEQKSILTKLGFKPSKRVKTPKAKKALPTLKGYDILLYTECQLCKQERMEAFRMTPMNYKNGKEPYLQSFPIKMNTLSNNYRNESKTIPSCIYCHENLLEKSKEELIEMVLRFNKARNLWRKPK